MSVGHQLQVTRQFAAYSAEVLSDARHRSPISDKWRSDPEVSAVFDGQSRVSVAAMGMLATMAYDMAHVDHEGLPEQRSMATRLGGLTILLTDIVDDVVDQRDVAVPTKNAYLGEIAAHLLDGQQPLGTARPPAMRAAHLLAGYLHEELAQRGGLPRFTEIIEPLVDTVKTQFVSTDPGEQFAAVENIGALCGEIAAGAVEVVEGRRYPDVVIAMRGIGAYAECLDHGHEVKEDVREDNMCYSTLFLAQHGDTPANRALVKAQLLGAADKTFAVSRTPLSQGQLVIHDTARHMLDFKNVVHKPVKDLRRQMAPARVGERLEAHGAAR